MDQEHNNYELPDASLPPRKLGWFAASVAAHVFLLVALIYFARIRPPEHQWVLAYMIDPAAGGSAGAAPAGGAAAEASLDPTPLSPPERPMRLAEPSPPDSALVSTPILPARELLSRLDFDDASMRDPRDSARDASRSRGAAGADGSDGTDGTSGDGDSSAGGTLAHADYGASPPPAYPIRARRRGEQGTVMLRVLVGADGCVLRAEVTQSSGYRRLDQAALEAVRKRWHFVAARREGHAVQSWVLVPIRFTLTEASASP